jgi:hypothetical protein
MVSNSYSLTLTIHPAFLVKSNADVNAVDLGIFMGSMILNIS